MTAAVTTATVAAAAAAVPVIRGLRVYVLPNGDTTSERIEIPLTELTSHGKMSKPIQPQPPALAAAGSASAASAAASKHSPSGSKPKLLTAPPPANTVWSSAVRFRYTE